MSQTQQNNITKRTARNRLLGGWSVIDTFSLGMRRNMRVRFIAFLGIILTLSILLLSFLSERFEAGDIRVPIATLVLIIFIGALVFAAFLILEIITLFRSGTLQGPTQRRLVTLFALMALVPTVIVAIISTITLNFGVDSWFSARVRNVVTTSYETARTYDLEHEQEFTMEGDLVFQRLIAIQNSPYFGSERERLEFAVARSTGNISHSFILETNQNIIARGPSSYAFDITFPTSDELVSLSDQYYLILKRPDLNEMIYLRTLREAKEDTPGLIMYLSREIDGEIFNLLDQSEKTVEFYKDSEQNRQNLLLSYGLFYLTISIIILMLAIWAGLFFSGRLTRPIGRLVRAAERISDGDFSSRVVDTGDNDEFSLLSRTFNQMASGVQDHQGKLKKAVSLSDSERRRFNKVLEGVSSGVMGVDGKGKVNFINSAAMEILKISGKKTALKIKDIAPEFVETWQSVQMNDEGVVQKQLNLIRDGSQETLFLKATPADKRNTGNCILSFDVVSDLVQAQRLAAWGDVARRIAHEIKNPLTPIRLSAERINRRFSKQITEDVEKFSDLTNVIVRQTQDIQHIVDEFARFSRMPEASKNHDDWIDAIKQAVTLQEQNEIGVQVEHQGLDHAYGVFDKSQFGQVFTNLLKNAIESIEARKLLDGDESETGHIWVTTQMQKDLLEIDIQDNGTGFPADKSRLFEPYMTLKETGTGLGLPIVKKIIEDHDGKISLHDREDNQQGARITIRVPATTKLK